MTPERYQKVGEHYRAVQELEPRARVAYLERACAGDDELRREVESLLGYQSAAETFIEQPALEIAAQDLAEEQSARVIGQHLSHYQILSLLGAGGMGEVYLARDTLLGRQVAIKLLPAQFTTNAERVQRFEREARAASALNHPNILTVHEIGSADETHFIVTEYIKGETLRQRLRGGRLSLTTTVDLALQVAAALAAAHEAGIIHRDIKPENIMRREDGLVKVLDFGLAKLTPMRNADFGMRNEEAATLLQAEQNSPQSTAPGTVMGTVAYMSPEQARGQRVDARTDIFSLGVVLYEMLAGRPPFMGETASHIIVAILETAPPPLTQLVKELPAELEQIINHALAKPVDERYASAKDLLTDLKRLQTHLLVEAELEHSSSADKQAAAEPARITNEAVAHPTAAAAWQPPLVTTDLIQSGKRHPRAVLVTLAISIAVIVALIVAFRGRRELPPEPSLQAVPLTTMEGSETTPTLSPDGNQVAFSWNGESGENFDLYIQVIGAGSPHRLTTDPAQDTAPAWSPDGRYIAFMRSTGVNGESAIYLVPPLGGTERKVAEGVFLRRHEFWPTRLGWSPDGKTLFFSELDGGTQGIFTVAVETGEKRRLTSPPTYGDYSLAVSPDGETVAFARLTQAGLASSIYVAPIRGGEPRLLVPPPGGSLSLTWVPDGKEIVYGSTEAVGFTPSLWKIAVAGGEPRRLPILGDGGIMPVISPTGRRLIYVRRTRNANIWRYDRPAREGEPWQRRKLISSTYLEAAPQISPMASASPLLLPAPGSNRSGARRATARTSIN